MRALSYLNKYFVKYKWRLFLGILFIAISNIVQIFGPMVVREAIDFVKEVTDATGSISAGKSVALDTPVILRTAMNILGLGPGTGELSTMEEVLAAITTAAIVLSVLYIMIAVIKGFFLFLTRQTIIIMSRYIEYDLKNEVYDQYQKLDMAFFKRNNTGDLMNRISEDVSKVRMYLGPAVMYTLNLVFLFIFVISMMISVNAELTLYVLTPLPVMSVIIYYVSSIINKKSEAVQRQQSRLSTFVQEAFSGIRVLKAYKREQKFRKDFGEEADQYLDRSMGLAKTNALFMPTIITLIGLSTIITIYLGGLKAIDGTITIGNIAEFVMYVNMLTWPFASVGWVTSLVQRAAASQTRINEFLHVEPEIRNTGTYSGEIQGHVEFRDVTFTYPDSGITALKNVSFDVQPGKSLAIIGRTGSGKSTIAALLCRLYDPTTGEILVDGHNLKEWNLDYLRSNTGYVPQEVFLFSDSIENNISFGLKSEDVSKELVEEAAKKANVHHNIVNFPKGYETTLGERGINLSGGQKQRISIARAIIREPKLLIFDDCLSAVDTETEEKILKNLREVMRGKTTVLISHRVSAVKSADHIIVLDEGQIIEQGNHQTLLALGGAYTDLHEQQLLEGEKINP